MFNNHLLQQTLEHYTQWNKPGLLVVTGDPDITVHNHHDQHGHHQRDKAEQVITWVAAGRPGWQLKRHSRLARVSTWAVTMCVVGVIANT